MLTATVVMIQYSVPLKCCFIYQTLPCAPGLVHVQYFYWVSTTEGADRQIDRVPFW